MKRVARSLVVRVLGWQVRRLYRKQDFTTVGVVGSIGKTSTKFAIATVLAEGRRVRFQEGNYNDLVTVPLVFFGLNQPSLFNPFAWLRLFWRIEGQLRRPYPYDVVVVELGTDGPGQLAEFGRYVKLDLTVVTAITPEHMEFFKSMKAVAAEEFSVQAFSKQLVINADLCDDEYRPSSEMILFGESAADYKIGKPAFSKDKASFTVQKSGNDWLKADMTAVAKSEVYSATAAAAVADLVGLDAADIKKGIAKIKPVSGRMQRLKGIKDSLILDETYNASPTAVMSALDSLYLMDVPQKIAVLGNMNELGDMAEQAHKDVGEYCDAKQLDLVVTIGPDANEFLAPAAKSKGCTVVTCSDPYAAAEAVKKLLKNKAAILVKGSQNNVYAEETVKLLLANKADAKLLVRQSPEWMAKKKSNFS